MGSSFTPELKKVLRAQGCRIERPGRGDHELGGGCVQEKSVRLARELLAGMGGLFGLPGASVAMLRHGGLRDAQASALLASREIASRLALQSIPKRRPLDPPGSVARYLLLRYQQRDQEVMGALFLDIRHRLLSDQEIFRGTLCRAEVEPREIRGFE